MKNSFLTYFFFIIFFSFNSFAEEFVFQTSEIKILDEGNYIEAMNGKAVSADKNIEVNSVKFKYNKKKNLLIAFDGSALLKKENIKIDFQEIMIDQKNLVISTKKKTKITDLKRNLSLESIDVNFDKRKKILESDTKTTLKDTYGNLISTEYFSFDMDKDILKIENSKIQDSDNNIFKIDLAYINTKTNKLFGKDIEIDLNNRSFNKDNEPRLKGKTVLYNDEFTEVTKGIFTTCKKRDKCPPWQLSAEKIKHDKRKNTINYKNALLKVYDVPVFYFPKFFHPDPTVKRKSGFLIPTLKSSNNSNSYISIPYFHVISQSKDITFSPRIYSSDHFLIQNEYRQVTANSKSIVDFSFYEEKNKDSKNHFFYNLNSNLNFDYFEDSNLKLEIKRTSNDTYLRAKKIYSDINDNNNVLESSLSLDLYSEDLSIDANVKIYENLDRIKSDRYEFILPEINLVKNLENKTNLDGNFVFKSNNLFKNYDTNIFETLNINDLVFNSNPKISQNGFYNNYEFILRNSNTDSENSTNYKNKESSYVSGLFQFNSSLPMIKESVNYKNIIKPKIALKISPNQKKNNSIESFTRTDVNNIYGLNRLASKDSLESGISFTYGNEFKRINKKDARENLVIKLANNLRIEENKDLPSNNQMGLQTSNLFGEITFDPSEFFTTKYNFSKKNNLDDFTYESIITTLNFKNFVTTFDYINENESQDGLKSYLLSKLQYNLNSSNNISFSTRENKETNLTEYYNFVYQYKNDCLAASIEYNKSYYDDRDLKPEENVFFKLTIMPFGQIASTPNLLE